RERKEDLPLLLEKFIAEAAQALGLQPAPTPVPQLVNLLECYDFPGNVRELRAMVMDAVAHHTRGALSMELFRHALGAKVKGVELPRSAESLDDAPCSWPQGRKPPTLKEAEEYLIAHAMKASRGNQGIAATLLGLTRQALNQRIARRESRPVRG
ncbi:MAG: sigma-54-dependent Fis family transcriptional regulator, partial [Magnetococcales bacterium]|nr:sigma-54-dependent Fis family transcriptional regulator [Magnetococcales bacterium]